MLNFIAKPKSTITTSKSNSQTVNTSKVDVKDELWSTKYMPKSIKDSAMHSSKVVIFILILLDV
jgi:hypothetical protein